MPSYLQYYKERCDCMYETSNIYLITNLINHKQYVGQANNIKERWNRHKFDYKRLKGRYLYRAMCKYGFENFSFEVIETNIPLEEIHAKEMSWIKLLNTKAPNGYNMTSGGEGSHNRPMTEETKAKLYAANKGRKATEESRKKMSISQTKRHASPEVRKQISDSLKNNKEAIAKATKTIAEVNKNMTHEQRMKYQALSVEKRSKPIKAMNLSDGSIVEFKSLRTAAEWLRENTEHKRACHTTLSKILREKQDYVYYGYMWELKSK